jgi:CHAT domain-containing protein
MQAAGAEEGKDVTQLLGQARSLLKQPAQRRAGEALVFQAIGLFDPAHPTDRQAFQILADELRISLRDQAALSQFPLQRFAELKMPADDPLVDLYARILAADYAVHAGLQVGVGDNERLTQFLVEIADGAHVAKYDRFAVLLYRVAIRWGAGTNRVMDQYISDRAPIRDKLDGALLALGEVPVGGTAPRELSGMDQTTLAGCRGEASTVAARLVHQAQSQLLGHDTQGSLSTTGDLLSRLAACRRGDADVELDIDMAEAYVVEGRAHWVRGELGSATASFERFATTYERILDESLMTLSEQGGEVPYLRMVSDVNFALNFLSTSSEPAAREIALRLLASRTGRLMEMEGERAHRYRKFGETASPLMRWRAMRATLLLRGRSPAYQGLIPAAHIPHSLSDQPGMSPLVQTIGQLQFAEEQASRAMTGSAKAFVTTAVTNDQLRAALDEQTLELVYALIEDVDPWTGVKPGSARYVLWTLSRAEIGPPRILTPATDLETLARDYLAAIDALRNGPRSPAESASVKVGARKLRTLVLPDAVDIAPFRRLLVVGDGVLLRLPFGALASGNGSSLIADHDVLVANGLRMALRPPSIDANGGPPLLLGISLPLPGPTGSGIEQKDLLTARFGALQSAQHEVEVIGKILGVKADVPKSDMATESVVKAARSPSVLHLATHGEYIAQGGSGWLDNLSLSAKTPNGRLPPPAGVANPWLHAYLAMAEYNTLRPLEADDGILTDAEILELNLDGTTLAVASSCSSGVGPIQVGSGIYSIRSAFALAGAKTQVVSLWSVDDLGAVEFMKTFYGLMRDGAKTLDAFFQTQRRQMQDSNYADPYYWAAFSISGANETLPGVR